MTAHAPPPAGRGPSPGVTIIGWCAAAWCLLFAAVNAWDLATGISTRFGSHARAITVLSAFVFVLKLAGAVAALAAVAPKRIQLPTWPVAVTLWGAFGLLGIYSAGNLVISIGTVTGLLKPSGAWTAAGGVSLRAVLFVLFFIAGAAAFGTLAIWFHRRHRLSWGPVLLGLVGAPLLLALILAVAPAILV
jgi:hypothetical protein